MIAAVVILSAFAALWGCAGIVESHADQVYFTIPIVVSLVLGAIAFRSVSRRPPRSPGDGRRIRRLVGLWTGIEVAAMIVAVNLLQYMHLTALALAAVCGIVGLHFLPLARYIPATIYWSTGGALIALSVFGFAVPAIVTPAIVGFGAAIILWTTICAFTFGNSARSAPMAFPNSRQ